MVTVEPETKWIPNSDSVSNLVPECKILGKCDNAKLFLQMFESCCFSEIFLWLLHIKMNLGEESSPRLVFVWKVHIILEKSGDFK